MKTAPPPSDEREIDGPGGTRLYVRRWRAGGGSGTGTGTGTKGLLAIVPGFSDHGARYPWLVAAALDAGFEVASLDTRGHGRSGGRRGHVERFDEYLLDVDRFVAECRRTGPPPPPLYLWAHSMGGLIALAYFSAGFGRGAGISAAVVCAPPFRIVAPVPRWKTSLARAFSRFAPAVPFGSPVRPEDLSRDLAVGHAYLKDPLVHQTCTPRLFTEMGNTASRLFANPHDYGVPTLFIHGSDDKLIDPAGTRSYFERSPLATKELRLYEGARHEVHNDPAGPDAFRDAFRFFETHAPKTPAAGEPLAESAGRRS